MFLVRFQVRPRVRHHRNNFCFSSQNRLFLTLDIRGKETKDRGKCTRGHFPDLDPKSRLWH